MKSNAEANAAAIRNDDRNQPPEPEPKPKSKLVKDPEALALATIIESLSKLEPKTRARVLEYIYDRFKTEQQP